MVKNNQWLLVTVDSTGRKTEEQRHVSNKTTALNINSGAQNLTVLCLCFLTLALMMTPSAAQQAPVYNSNEAAQTEIRLQQMETQIRELTGKVEEQLYEINSLKQQIEPLEIMATPSTQETAPATMPAQQESVMNVVTPKPAQQQSPAYNEGADPLNLQYEPAIQEETPLTGGDAAAQYEAAYTQLKLRQYDNARVSFENFLKMYSDNILAANAHYWLGETFYVQGSYSEAARAFAKGFQQFPDSAKSPDMLLKLGMSLKGMGKSEQACVALSQLPIKFPAGPKPVLDLAEKQMQELECGSNSE